MPSGIFLEWGRRRRRENGKYSTTIAEINKMRLQPNTRKLTAYPA
jgi:hypothetical protein